SQADWISHGISIFAALVGAVVGGWMARAAGDRLHEKRVEADAQARKEERDANTAERTQERSENLRERRAERDANALERKQERESSAREREEARNKELDARRNQLVRRVRRILNRAASLGENVPPATDFLPLGKRGAEMRLL